VAAYRAALYRISTEPLTDSVQSLQPVKMGGWWRWALVSPDGVVHSRMVRVSASVNLPLHHKVQKLSSGTGSPRWSWKMGHKTVVVVGGEKLKQLQLPTLKYRRLCGDMIEVVKVVHKYYDSEAAVKLNFNTFNTTRGNYGLR